MNDSAWSSIIKKNFTLLIYGDDIHVMRHSHHPHALPAAGIVTRTAHQFLRSSSATYVHSIAASLASLSVKLHSVCVLS